MSETQLSGWCSVPPGITNHDSACRVCQMRMNAGQIARCDCAGHERDD